MDAEDLAVSPERPPTCQANVKTSSLLGLCEFKGHGIQHSTYIHT